ncbi:MAG: undecaprenyl-phosphate glucose phosphotransferase [Hyphomicrobium sp.]|uniref:undecaprenyl-phosphate glucose phosphotransferase n=1 Tax=Hyphomicrobium sp. TaxID=82 RepID=UPI003D0BEE81
MLSPVILAGMVRLAEFLLTLASGLAIAMLYHGDTAVAGDELYDATFLLASLGVIAALDLLGLYRPQALGSVHRNLPRLMLGWGTGFALVIAAAFFLKAGHELSRAWLALWFVVGGVLLIGWRAGVGILVQRLTRSGRLLRRAVVYGTGPIADDLVRKLEADTSAQIRIVGVFDDRADARATDAAGRYPRLGTLDEMLNVSRVLRVDLVIVALPLAGEQRLIDVASRISELPADVRLPAQATSIRLARRLYSHVGEVAMIDLHDRPIADWGHVAKWVFDKTIGLSALVLLAPVMALVALAIKLDSRGPVLFRQKRYGFNNELIEVLKFRSMHTALSDANADRLVTRSDPRVTRVGRFIRRTSLDELPQLFNVLTGELSLVGPRPHALAAKAEDQLYNEVVARYFARHKVKPGITGWAQISGWRGETDTREKIEKRVEHDLYYIENWSVFFDIYILAATPFALLKSENAY